MDRIDEIRKRWEEVEAWEAVDSCGDWSVRQTNDPWEPIAAWSRVYPECAIGLDEDDAKLIAAAPTDIHALLARIAELEGRRCETCAEWQQHPKPGIDDGRLWGDCGASDFAHYDDMWTPAGHYCKAWRMRQ